MFRVTARILYKDGRSATIKRFPPTEEGLRQAKMLASDQAKFADVRGAVIIEANGDRHIFTNQGEYFGTVRVIKEALCFKTNSS